MKRQEHLSGLKVIPREFRAFFEGLLLVSGLMVLAIVGFLIEGIGKIFTCWKKLIYLLGVLLLFGIAAWFYWVLYMPNPGNSGEFRTVFIPRGASARQVAELLAKEKIVFSPDRFLLAAKLYKARRELKAGLYRLPLGESNAKVVRILRKGEVAEIKVSLPEGIRARKMASIFQRKVGVDSAKFMALVKDTAFVHALGIDANSLAGYLFPNTYFFPYEAGAKIVIRTLVDHFQKVFNDTLKNRTKEMGWTIHQVVTLASIIEGEAKIDSERALISAVYHNRLKKGMLLQASPTIQFLIPNGPRRLLNKDLEIDSPYNTYRHPGLPPGPINNPGRKSILAALYPAKVDYLYFVAKGDGSHVFTTTLRAHLIAKRNLDRLRREYYRKHHNKWPERDYKP